MLGNVQNISGTTKIIDFRVTETLFQLTQKSRDFWCKDSSSPLHDQELLMPSEIGGS